MIYYILFSGRGRTLLANELGADDPFAMDPAEIVERVLAAGYTSEVARPKADPWRALGRVTTVHREGQVFIVAVSRDAHEISVQEERVDPYDP